MGMRRVDGVRKPQLGVLASLLREKSHILAGTRRLDSRSESGFELELSTRQLQWVCRLGRLQKKTIVRCCTLNL